MAKPEPEKTDKSQPADPRDRLINPEEWGGFDKRDVAQGDRPQTGRPPRKRD